VSRVASPVAPASWFIRRIACASPRRVSARARLALVVAAGVVAACGARHPTDAEHTPVTIQLLAVLPVEVVRAGDAPDAPPPTESGLAVTAQLYRVLAEQTEFRFVPDLTVADAVETPELRSANSLVDRAVALGKDVGADGVIFGRVLRYQKRVGTDLGATQPASVSFDLGLVAVSTGEVLWRGRFDQTQEPLTSNLLKWWMFWRAGPRWMTASELAGLGVDRLFRDMTATVNRLGSAPPKEVPAS
jgi:hypothetical protein